MESKTELWSIGHSTHASNSFIDMLQSFEIKLVADVRSFPGSKRYPHFNKEILAASLAETAIEYQHLPELGGRRRTRPDSLNVAWRNLAFRGYADYMETDSFRDGIERLLKLAALRRTVMMCAEAVWWRCHRSLIADYLKTRSVQIKHIMALGKAEGHLFTSAARIVNGELSYRGILND